MARRFLIGGCLLAALAGVWLLDARVVGRPVASRVVIWLCALGALYETLALVRRRMPLAPGAFFTGGIALIAVVLPSLAVGRAVEGPLLAAAIFLAGWVRLLALAPVHGGAAGAFPEAAAIAAATAYTGGLLAFLDRIAAEQGVTALLAVVLVSKASDVGGYLFGTLFGKRKIVSLVSPGKTWLGTFAGVAASAVTAVLLARALGEQPAWYLAASGALIGMASFAGDVGASAVKRFAGAKDSASLLPAFGGILDLVDGLLLAGPVALTCLYRG